VTCTKGNGTQPVATGPPLPAGTNPLAFPGLASGDLDILFHAVQARMARTVGDEFAAACALQGHEANARIRSTVLECLNDMGQLHSMVNHEVGRRRQLEAQLHDLQGVLAGLQAELLISKADEFEARRRARHDGLTNLANAELFRERLDAALTQVGAPPLAVLFIDIDHFKAVNDGYGHDTGDAVLRIVAARLTQGVRSMDLVGRVGGDEFACLLSGVWDRADLQLLVRNLFSAMVSPLKVGALLLSVRPSIGVAMFPADGTTSGKLLHNADVAMYLAKRRKSGVAFFDERPTHGPLLELDDLAPAVQTGCSGHSAGRGLDARLDARAVRAPPGAAPARRPPSSAATGSSEGPAFDR